MHRIMQKYTSNSDKQERYGCSPIKDCFFLHKSSSFRVDFNTYMSFLGSVKHYAQICLHKSEAIEEMSMSTNCFYIEQNAITFIVNVFVVKFKL